jgi:hypothetical protein
LRPQAPKRFFFPKCFFFAKKKDFAAAGIAPFFFAKKKAVYGKEKSV